MRRQRWTSRPCLAKSLLIKNGKRRSGDCARKAAGISAGGVADHMVTQLLRQSDADVFKLYSQAKLGVMREALVKLDRQANERGISSTERVI